MRKDVFYYFKKSVAFFDLKAKAIPPIVFLAVLALYSLYFYINRIDYQEYSRQASQYLSPEGAIMPPQASLSAMIGGIVIMLLINIVSFVYLDAVIREAKHEDYAGGDCLRAALKCFPRLTGITVLKNIILAAGLFLFIIPGIYLAILLIFAECAALDKNNGVTLSLKFSRTLTNKRRGDIFKIELFCNLVIAIFVILLLFIFSSNNVVVFQYILLFTLSLCTLIEHKLTAHLYVDALAAFEGRTETAASENPGGGDGNVKAKNEGADLEGKGENRESAVVDREGSVVDREGADVKDEKDNS